MKLPIFRNVNDGRVYDSNNRTMFFVNDPTTADEIVEIVNKITALTARVAELEAVCNKFIEIMEIPDFEMTDAEKELLIDARRLLATAPAKE